MPDKKSAIESFAISLGNAPGFTAQAKDLEKWHILVCADFGFYSPDVFPVRIADWNEFLASRNIVLSGTVHDPASKDKSLGYVEIPIRTIKDFSLDSVLRNAEPFCAFYKTCFALEQLCDGKTDVATCVSMIEKAGLPRKEVDDILSVLKGSVPQKINTPEINEIKTRSAIDAILSMVDCGDTQISSTTVKKPASALDALFTAVTKGSTVLFDKDAIRAYCAACKDAVRTLAARCMKEHWFKSRLSSWKSLRLLAQKIGRKTELQLHATSVPFENAADGFEQMLAQCNNKGCLPDVVVFDYPLSFSNANVDRLKKISHIAETYKTTVCSSLDARTYASLELERRESVLDTFASPLFLPYKAFREQIESRCVCISAPGFCLDQNEPDVLGPSCYYIAIRFADALLNFYDPFSIKNRGASRSDSFETSGLFPSGVSESVSRECAAMGITLFPKQCDDSLFGNAVAAAADTIVANRYTPLFFNMLVNRIVRLSGLFLLSLDKEMDSQDKAMRCANYVKKELMPYQVLRTADQVAGHVLSDGSIEIVVNSDNAISGETICFSFSF